MVKGLNPENFIKEFEPGSNPFEVTIVRLINPKGVDIRSMDKPLLVKLLSRIKMRAFSDAHRKAFENLVKSIDVKEQFCGIFTPDVSEIYFDGDVMIVDLTSYLKPGMETKIGKLFQVAMESPKVHEERIPNKELTDRAITNRFLRNVDTGMSIADALKLAIQQQENGEPEPEARPYITPPPLPPPPPPPPQPATRTPRAEPPVVKVSANPMDAVIDDKIANMERVAKEREVADAKEEAVVKGRKARKAIKRMKKKTKDSDDEEAMEEDSQPRPEPPEATAPDMDDSSPEVSATQDDIPTSQPEEKGQMVPPPPEVTKGPDIDLMVAKPENGPSSDPGLGNLLSKLKGIDLEAPKDLPKEAPRVSEEFKAAPPPPRKEEPVVERPPERTPLRFPPAPSIGEPETTKTPVTNGAKEPEKPKPKSGESGLDELMKKLKSHSLK